MIHQPGDRFTLNKAKIAASRRNSEAAVTFLVSFIGKQAVLCSFDCSTNIDTWEKAAG